MDWVIKGVLARASRPGSVEGVSRAAIDEWISNAHGMGIRTILCLLADEHLALYKKSLSQATRSTSRWNAAYRGRPGQCSFTARRESIAPGRS